MVQVGVEVGFKLKQKLSTREVLYEYFLEQNILPVCELVSKCKPLFLNQNL